MPRRSKKRRGAGYFDGFLNNISASVESAKQGLANATSDITNKSKHAIQNAREQAGNVIAGKPGSEPMSPAPMSPAPMQPAPMQPAPMNPAPMGYLPDKLPVDEEEDMKPLAPPIGGRRRRRRRKTKRKTKKSKRRRRKKSRKTKKRRRRRRRR